MEPLQAIELIAEHIKKKETLPEEALSEDFHVAVIKAFDILDLKDEYKSKLDGNEVFAINLPDAIPQIKVTTPILLTSRDLDTTSNSIQKLSVQSRLDHLIWLTTNSQQQT